MDNNKIFWLLCQLTSDLSRREDTARQSVLHSLMPVMLERQHTVSETRSTLTMTFIHLYWIVLQKAMDGAKDRETIDLLALLAFAFSS